MPVWRYHGEEGRVGMDWDKLRIFHAVAEQGSITQAGEVLHLSQSAVSRQIHALERSVGTPLFHRHPRGLLLTSEGEILFETTARIVSSLNDATGRIRGVKEGVYGGLRVTCTVDFGLLWLIPRLPILMERHPGLTIDLAMTETVLDLPMRAADVAIRQRRPRQADVIARELHASPVLLWASQAYLDRAGIPEVRADLERHVLIRYSAQAPQPVETLDWLFVERSGEAALRARIAVNTQMGILEAVRQGVGIGILPRYLGEAQGFVRVLPDLAGPAIPLYFVYASEMRRSKRVAVLKTFIEEEMDKSS